MGTLRTKVLAAFLAGILITLGVLTIRGWVDHVERHINAIEEYLTAHPIPQLQLQEIPQSHKESHKGEISKPQQWKV